MNEEKKMNSKFLIPASVVKSLLKCASKDETRSHICGICVDTETGAVFATDGHAMSVREIDGTVEPPPWEQVVPHSRDFRVTMALDKGIGILATLKNRFKKDTFGKIAFEPVPNELGKYFLIFSTVEGDVTAKIETDSVEFESEVDLSEWKIGVNPALLIGALERLLVDCPKVGGQVQIDLGGRLDPFVLRTPQGKSNDVEVVMPQRV